MTETMKKLLSFCAALFALTAATPAADDNFSPWDAWRQGITGMEKGEQARDRADYVEALRAYREAVDSFRSVRRARPDWNQNFINGKITQCENEINSINRLLGERKTPAADPAPASPATPEPTQTSRRTRTPAAGSAELLKLQTELEQYKKKLFETATENELLRRQSSRAEATAKELENLMRERRELLEKNQLLEKRYRELEKQANAPSSELTAAKKQAIELQINAELLQKKLDLAAAEQLKAEKELAALVRQRNNLQKEKAEAAKAGEALNFELATLRKIRDNTVKERKAWDDREKELKDALAKGEKEAEARQKEIATLTRRLEELGKQSSALNPELLAENTKLRTAEAAARKALDAAAKNEQELQKKQSALQTEIAEVRSALLRVDDRRLQLEKDHKMLKTAADRQAAAEKLAGAELKTLREQNGKLAADLKSYAEKLEKAEKLLGSREQAERGAVSTLAAENKKLDAEAAGLKLAAKDLETRTAVADAAREKAEKEAAEARAELLKLRASADAATAQAKTAAKLVTDFDELKAEHEKLTRNFAALNLRARELQQKEEEFRQGQTELTALRAGNAELTRVRAALAAQERRNQTLLDENTRLRSSGAAPSAAPSAASAAAIVPAVIALPPPEAMTPEKVAELLDHAAKALRDDDRRIAAWNYAAVLAARPDHFEASRNLGELLLGEEKYAEAAERLSAAHGVKPGDDRTTLAYAAAQTGLGKYGNALALLEQVSSSRRRAYDYQLALGRALAGSGDAAAAEAAFTAAAGADAKAATPRLELARLLQAGRTAEAADYYEEAKKLGAKPDPALEPVLGKLLNERRELIEFLAAAAAEAEKHGDAVSALWYYRQLREQDPDDAVYPAKVGLYLLLQNQADEAVRELKEAAAPLPLATVAVAQLFRGDLPAAQAAAAAAVKANGGRPVGLPPEFRSFREKIAACPDEKTRKVLEAAVK